MDNLLPPGLRGYVLAQQQGQQQQAQQLGMLAQLAQLQGQQEERAMKQQLMPLQIKEHEAKLAQMMQQADLMKALGGLSGQATPEQLDMIGQRLALGGHPGAATVMNIADKRRKDLEQQQAVAQMKSVPGKTIMPDPQEAQQSADYGTPQVAPVTTQAQPGALSFLMDSPYVGAAAKQLQAQIDSGAMRNPDTIQARINNLLTVHSGREQSKSVQDAIAGRQQAARNDRIDFRVMFPPEHGGGDKPLTDVGKLNADLKAGRITQAQYDAAVSTKGYGAAAPLDASVAGEDFLKTLSPADASIVKALSDGRMQFPTGFALKSPYWQSMIQKVAQYNPKFDATKFGVRAAAQRTFVSGPEARNVTALNTVIGHLGTLSSAAEALQNQDLRLANTAINRAREELGDPRVVNFDTAKQAVAEETMRVFRQVGASEIEARQWGEKISRSGSPAQLRGTIATLGELLDSRVKAIERQYERSLSGGNPAQVDPANRGLLDRLRNPTAPAPAGGGWSIRQVP